MIPVRPAAAPSALLWISLWVLSGSAPAGAEIYRWTDAQGTVHFSQSLDQVPAEHRAAARGAAANDRPASIQTYTAPAAPKRRARRGREIQIPFQRQGSLMRVDALLNGHVTAPFLIDTGASGVTIPSWVAKQLDLRVGPDTPQVYVQTANGVTRRPLVTLDSVEVGGARVDNLPTTINPTMDIGLLGGAFFNNFIYRVDAASGVIGLVPNDGMRSGQDQASWRGRFQKLRAPLATLDDYLATRELKPGRVRELEKHREELVREIEALEREANRGGVPFAWRQ